MSAATGPLYLGLMSGTSADGIDAALVRFEPRLELVGAHTFPYPDALHQQVLALATTTSALPLAALGSLHTALGEAFASAALGLLERAGIAPAAVAAIGSHGQTVFHAANAASPFSLQLGHPAVIAERTGIPVIADFRSTDIAAGGQGAPLLPALHAALFAHPAHARVVLNLGGIANITLLAPGAPTLGFDTGPANALLDAWAGRHRGVSYDADGAWAASGTVDAELLADWLLDPYFAAEPPKSTGREYFNLAWLDPRLPPGIAPADVQATLLALSVRSVAEAIATHGRGAREVFVCGGGVHNTTLMQALAEALPGTRLASTAELGVDPAQVEAIGFAWLARAHLAGEAGNLPSVTGAAGPRILGGAWPAPGRPLPR